MDYSEDDFYPQRRMRQINEMKAAMNMGFGGARKSRRSGSKSARSTGRNSNRGGYETYESNSAGARRRVNKRSNNSRRGGAYDNFELEPLVLDYGAGRRVRRSNNSGSKRQSNNSGSKRRSNNNARGGANPWIQHVKNVARQNNMSYGDAMRVAGRSYRY